MVELIVIGFVAGIVAGISPCILPVLPVVLVAGATAPIPASSTVPGAGAAAAGPADPVPEYARPGGRARPVAVVAGLVVSFSLIILASSEIISLLGLPQDFLRDAGITLLVVVGLGFLFPPLAGVLERPFARIGSHQPSGQASGFVVGLALGVLFVPCAGPILAAITVAGATHRVGPTAVFLTLAFALGAAIPLLAVALAGSALIQRVRALRQRGPRVRQLSGVVLIVMALTIGFNAFTGLQTDVPGYTSSLQNRVEGSATVRRRLSALADGSAASRAASTPQPATTKPATTKPATTKPATTKAAGAAGAAGAAKSTITPEVSLASCNSNATALVNCGPAPAFAGITTWLNTPGGEPLSLASLRGKVVLVDFWTYSCINCERTLPHVEAWYKKYAADGLVVVGVHTPEFSFEHDVSNVRTEAASLGVHYPVAIDNNYGTWDAYDNEYWPADYLLDAQGIVRHVHFGEGDYAGTEGLIRQLLTEAHPAAVLPAASDIPDQTPTVETSPETYLGYKNLQYLFPQASETRNAPAVYSFPGSLPVGGFGLSGTWTDGPQEATAGAAARLELSFVADDVYLVLGGTGSLEVSIDGRHTQTIHVGGVPKLYRLYHSASVSTATLLLQAAPGVQAYDFTFG